MKLIKNHEFQVNWNTGECSCACGKWKSNVNSADMLNSLGEHLKRSSRKKAKHPQTNIFKKIK